MSGSDFDNLDFGQVQHARAGPTGRGLRVGVPGVLLHPSLSHLDVNFGPTTPATTVDDTGLDTDARWNTVLALIRPEEFTSRTRSPWRTAVCHPGPSRRPARARQSRS
jgi:hypothetical protein